MVWGTGVRNSKHNNSKCKRQAPNGHWQEARQPPKTVDDSSPVAHDNRMQNAWYRRASQTIAGVSARSSPRFDAGVLFSLSQASLAACARHAEAFSMCVGSLCAARCALGRAHTYCIPGICTRAYSRECDVYTRGLGGSHLQCAVQLEGDLLPDGVVAAVVHLHERAQRHGQRRSREVTLALVRVVRTQPHLQSGKRQAAPTDGQTEGRTDGRDGGSASGAPSLWPSTQLPPRGSLAKRASRIAGSLARSCSCLFFPCRGQGTPYATNRGVCVCLRQPRATLSNETGPRNSSRPPGGSVL